MRNIYITIISSLLIFNCNKSPDMLLEKGDKYLSALDYDNALTTYQNMIDKFPDDTLAQTAKYNIAWIELNNINDYNSGFKTLTEIAEKYPESQIGKSASDDIQNLPVWLMTKTQELRSDTSIVESIVVLDYLLKEFSDNAIIPEALYLKGNIYLNDKKDFYRALNTYQEIVQKHKGSSFEPMSQFMIGYIYANIQSDFPKAKTAYKEFLEKYPEHELAPSVQFEMEYLGKQINNIDELTSREK